MAVRPQIYQQLGIGHIRRSGSPRKTSAVGRHVAFSGVRFQGTSLEGGKDPQRVEVVAPRGDFAVLDDDNGNVSVAVGCPVATTLPSEEYSSTTDDVDGDWWDRRS